MALFRLTQPLAPPGVGGSCLCKQFPRHDCRACVAACPVNAIVPTAMTPTIDQDACLRCGQCLFVCPTDALQNLRPETRRYIAFTLVAPFSTLAPSVEELLMWHHQHGIRAVALDMETHPGWVRAVAALNLWLRELNAPVWQILPPPQKAINAERRHFLKASEVDVQSGTVSTGRQARRQALSAISEYQLALDRSQCIACGACTRVCTQKALQLTEGALTFTSSLCIGCASCAAVCPVQAIDIEKRVDENQILRFPWTQLTCRCCQRQFKTFNPETDRCSVCLRHQHGMREA